jgi:thiol:disulfide interchange protein/DsbC/DsbD-like thiol-disulfide interchange protein
MRLAARLAAFTWAGAMTAPLCIAPIRVDAAAAPQSHVAIELRAETHQIRPGQTVWIAFVERIEPGWHTYWTNPGDSGESTSLRWNLPSGYTIGEVQWPVPDVIPTGPLVDYGYSGEVVLLQRLQIPAEPGPTPAEIAVEAHWLVCRDICTPEHGRASITLRPAGPGIPAQSDPDAVSIAAARERLPRVFPGDVTLSVHRATVDLVFHHIHAVAGRALQPRVFPLSWGEIDNAAPQIPVLRADDLILNLKRGDLRDQPLAAMAGLLVLDVDRPASHGSEAFLFRATPPAPAPVNLAAAFAFAFLGGLILNFMPCVLPVLSLKALSLARTPRVPRVERAEGVAYLAGVLVSFAILATILLTLRHLGHAVGWGFQLQSPAFVLALAALLFALGLIMSGVLTVGASVAGLGDRWTRGAGLSSSFIVGVLATTAATPCTAPFMGAAVAYALSVAPGLGVAVLTTVGVGFATPMLLLHLAPRWRRFLPGTGPWMETVKELLAFPLYATTGWLVWVLSQQIGSDGVLVAMSMLTAIGFCCWLAGRTQRRTVLGPAIGAGLAVTVVAVAVFGIHAAMPTVRAPETARDGEARAYSEPAFRALRAQGQPVFLNVTAAWCITCMVNERMALSSDRVRHALLDAHVTYLKGDWTRQDPAITELLERFGRDGVPLYVFFPAGADATPVILPQLLTEGLVLSTIVPARPPT